MTKTEVANVFQASWHFVNRNHASYGTLGVLANGAHRHRRSNNVASESIISLSHRWGKFGVKRQKKGVVKLEK